MEGFVQNIVGSEDVEFVLEEVARDAGLGVAVRKFSEVASVAFSDADRVVGGIPKRLGEMKGPKQVVKVRRRR